MLAGTLVIGMVIGFLVTGAIGQRRAKRFERLRARDGFVEHMLRLIEPHDDTQRAETVPFLVETARRNREIVEGTRNAIDAEPDSRQVRLAPTLDTEQMRRLEGGRPAARNVSSVGKSFPAQGWTLMSNCVWGPAATASAGV